MSPARSERLERVLEILDAGEQSSPEPGYGTDVGPGSCARCQCHDPAPDGDLCGGCRAFLLGDIDDDPQDAERFVQGWPTESVDIAATLQWVNETYIAAVREAADVIVRVAQMVNGEP